MRSDCEISALKIFREVTKRRISKTSELVRNYIFKVNKNKTKKKTNDKERGKLGLTSEKFRL